MLALVCLASALASNDFVATVTWDNTTTFTACGDDIVKLQWNGFHNVQEMSDFDDCDSTINEELIGFNDTPHVMYTSLLSAAPGTTRYFQCTIHCVGGAKIAIHCPPLPTCTCKSGFAFSDNTVTRAFDTSTQYGGGCVPVTCDSSHCANGNQTICNPACKADNTCCGSCHAGYYLSRSTQNGAASNQCLPVKCPANSTSDTPTFENGEVFCTCAQTHYRSGWQVGPDSTQEDSLRKILITTAAENQDRYNLETCVDVASTCQPVANCGRATPKCVENIPYTGVCTDDSGVDACSTGYELVNTTCGVDENRNDCNQCDLISCVNGAIEF